MFGKSQNLELQCFEKGKIENSNLRKKAKFRIRTFLNETFRIPMNEKRKN